jgi:hypothetical protein
MCEHLLRVAHLGTGAATSDRSSEVGEDAPTLETQRVKQATPTMYIGQRCEEVFHTRRRFAGAAFDLRLARATRKY